eukprot:2684351-Prorocentrum_lima.AAC.1
MHRTVGLLKQCEGAPVPAYRFRFSLLLRGRHPRTGQSLGNPQPLRRCSGDGPAEAGVQTPAG